MATPFAAARSPACAGDDRDHPLARAGLPSWYCNGFPDPLLRRNLLHRALTAMSGRRFITLDIQIRIENAQTPLTRDYPAAQELTSC